MLIVTEQENSVKHAKLPFSLYSIRIPKKMRNDLEDFANRNEMQVSDAVRLAVTEMLNRENKRRTEKTTERFAQFCGGTV